MMLTDLSIVFLLKLLTEEKEKRKKKQPTTHYFLSLHILSLFHTHRVKVIVFPSVLP